MPLSGSPGNSGTQADRLSVSSPNGATHRKVLSLDRKNHAPEKGLEEILSTALMTADDELGQILREVDQISRILRSDSPDLETLRVASHPAVWSAVKQTLLDRELRYLALTDDLTCLYNRRGFYAAATQLLKVALRNARGLLLLFCDVDNLKKINDSYGHREGDQALVRTADALEQTIRSSDILARLGGDEFVVMALEAPGQAKEAILGRLAKNLKKANATEKRYELSLSIGVARFDPKRAVSLGELMAQADQAMYEQKRLRQKCWAVKA